MRPAAVVAAVIVALAAVAAVVALAGARSSPADPLVASGGEGLHLTTPDDPDERRALFCAPLTVDQETTTPTEALLDRTTDPSGRVDPIVTGMLDAAPSAVADDVAAIRAHLARAHRDVSPPLPLPPEVEERAAAVDDWVRERCPGGEALAAPAPG